MIAEVQRTRLSWGGRAIEMIGCHRYNSFSAYHFRYTVGLRLFEPNERQWARNPSPEPMRWLVRKGPGESLRRVIVPIHISWSQSRFLQPPRISSGYAQPSWASSTKRGMLTPRSTRWLRKSILSLKCSVPWTKASQTSLFRKCCSLANWPRRTNIDKMYCNPCTTAKGRCKCSIQSLRPCGRSRLERDFLGVQRRKSRFLSGSLFTYEIFSPIPRMYSSELCVLGVGDCLFQCQKCVASHLFGNCKEVLGITDPIPCFQSGFVDSARIHTEF